MMDDGCFEDIGLPNDGAEGYFETNSNTSHYAYDTGRDMIADLDQDDDLNMIELSERKDLLPRAMRP